MGEARQHCGVTELFEQYGAYVCRALRYLGVAEDDVADVCQEVFVVVHCKLASFEGKSSLKTWIYGICLKKAARYRVQRRRERPMGDLSEGRHAPSTAGGQPRAEVRRELLRLLGQLDHKQRDVLVLHEIESLTLQEISEVLSSPVQTIYSRLVAARRTIARIAADRVQRPAR